MFKACISLLLCTVLLYSSVLNMFAADNSNIKPIKDIKTQPETIGTSVELSKQPISKIGLSENLNAPKFMFKELKDKNKSNIKGNKSDNSEMMAKNSVSSSVYGDVYNTDPDNAIYVDIDTITSGYITAEGEQRWYFFQANNPAKITVYMESVNDVNIDYNLNLYKLDQINMTLNQIAYSAYGPANNEQLSALADAGYYFICVNSVKGFDTSNPFAFTVKLSDKYDAAEPDDNILTCKQGSLPFSVQQTIDNEFDTDWVSINIDKTKYITLQFSNVPQNCEYKVDIFNSDLYGLATLSKNNTYTFVLQPGTYYFRVRSESGFDEDNDYLLKMNGADYIEGASIISSSPDGNYILQLDSNNKLYVNGNNIACSWERTYQFNYPEGGYLYRSQSIWDTTARAATGVAYGSYNSNYTGSINHAFAVRVKYIGYMYWYTRYYNGGPMDHTQTDIYGNNTPRVTDDSDPSIYLIINADTSKVADMYSSLNYYYGLGIETATFQ